MEGEGQNAEIGISADEVNNNTCEGEGGWELYLPTLLWIMPSGKNVLKSQNLNIGVKRKCCVDKDQEKYQITGRHSYEMY